jgi:hypothetical protein
MRYRHIADLQDEIANAISRIYELAAHHSLSTGHADTIESLLDELLPQLEDRLRAAQQWQPIETAPKDGTTFIARQDPADIYMESWDDWYGSKEGKRWNGEPTHWIPMPKEAK